MDPCIVAPPLAGQVLGAEAGAFVLAEWRDPGGPSGPPRLIAPRHVHYSDDEARYVLDGRLRVQVGSHEVEVPTGAGAFVPRGTPHTNWNPDRAPVRYLLVMTPLIYQLIQALHALADHSPAALRAVFRAYESDLLEP
jgi:mannose-6-phosphate isomerase-like protein (cupin superfamily)